MRRQEFELDYEQGNLHLSQSFAASGQIEDEIGWRTVHLTVRPTHHVFPWGVFVGLVVFGLWAVWSNAMPLSVLVLFGAGLVGFVWLLNVFHFPAVAVKTVAGALAEELEGEVSGRR